MIDPRTDLGMIPQQSPSKKAVFFWCGAQQKPWHFGGVEFLITISGPGLDAMLVADSTFRRTPPLHLMVG